MGKKVNIIFAGGNQQRWNASMVENSPPIKQLVELPDGEILIDKIQAQFHNSIVVTNNKAIELHAKTVRHDEPDCSCLIEALFGTRVLWSDWTTILLGDVVYGEETVKKIKQQVDPIMFYGDKGEIYAIKFSKDMINTMLLAIHNLVHKEDWTSKFGKLWNLYRIIAGVDYRRHEITALFNYIADCTDFDNVQRYMKYMENAEKQRISK